VSRIVEGLKKLAERARRGLPPVGQTPHDEIFRENKWRLLRFRPVVPEAQRKRTPILLVPSLINRWYILDLQPGRSFAEWLVAAGHDVYIIDWGTPGAEDRYLTFDDICDRYLGRAVRQVATPQAAAMRAPTAARMAIPSRSPAAAAMVATTPNQPAETPRATASERVNGGGDRMCAPFPHQRACMSMRTV